MRVAVITPYFKEPASWLRRCIDSVKAQTHRCEHLLVADGHPQGWLDGSQVRHLKLDRSHADYGNTPRSLGAQMAVAEGFDAVAFLDADNWYEPGHIADCVALAVRTDADVVTCRRRLVREDGSEIPYVTHEDKTGAHVDTSCLFLLFGAFHTLPRWLLMPRPMSILGDRYYLQSLRAEGLKEARTGSISVNYQCGFADVYEAIGEVPPAFAKAGLPTHQLSEWLSLLQPGDLAHVERLCGCRLAMASDVRS